MTTTRVPSEAELIELENWFGKLCRERFDPALLDWLDDDIDLEQWQDRYPELPVEPIERMRLIDTMRALLDLARTVQNPEK